MIRVPISETPSNLIEIQPVEPVFGMLLHFVFKLQDYVHIEDKNTCHDHE